MIEIEEADNGWVLTYPSLNVEGITREVIEFDDTSEDDGLNHCNALQTLLYKIMEATGNYGSKHDAYRVFVKVEKQ